jgi:translation initiation factor 5B
MPQEQDPQIRQPIISVLGHVDAGKTTLLDYIRGSVVAEQESGGITQMIGSTTVPIEKIDGICGDLLEQLDTDLHIPGLLFIDTPGHAAFTSLRKRGGALSDIAVVVVDVTDGVQPQTAEAIDILKESGTPFVVALNKVDTIQGWQSTEGSFLANYRKQEDRIQKRLDEAIYEVMGDFSDEDLTVDRYDRVDDFTEKIGVVPMSAETGEGIPDLLMVLAGLAQRYLADRLEVHPGEGKGTVLEVNEVQGFGTTIDIILYDGAIHKDDQLVVGSRDKAINTKIKALLEPQPLQEMRTEQGFRSINDVSAAAGVKIAAPGLDSVVAGSPLRTVQDEADIDEAVDEVEAELESFAIETAQHGVIVRADSLGSLEAIMDFIADRDIAVKTAEVGKVTKKDIVEAENEAEHEHRSILAFNTGTTDTAEDELESADIHYIADDIIYNLVDRYEEWTEELAERQREQVLDSITRPAKIRLLPDHVFRSSDPAVVGVEILNGVLNTGSSLMDPDGNSRGRVKAIQEEGESIESATKGDEVAVSITSVTVGRQIEEGDELYTDITGKDYKIIQRMDDAFTAGELRVLDDIVAIKDEQDPRWKLG